MFKYTSKISLKKLGVITLLALLCLSTSAMQAFEAHVVNVTAQIVNNVPMISPDTICEPGTGDPMFVQISTSLTGAKIVYNLQGGTPDCDTHTQYDSPVNLEFTSDTTVKARTCYNDSQSAVIEKLISVIDCGQGPVCDPQIELVDNGSFEQPVVEDEHDWDIFITPNVPHWNISWMSGMPTQDGDYTRPENANLELHAGVNNWTPADGEQYAELDTDWYGPGHSQSNEPASVHIDQNIETIVDETYTVTFYASPRPDTDAGNNRLQVNAGTISDTIELGAGGSNTNWTQHTYEFVAGSESSLLRFSDLGIADSLGTFLDNVSVRCNPNPTPPAPVCGNQIIEEGETCDDGENNGTPGYCNIDCSGQTEEEEEEPAMCMKINEVYYDPDDEHGGANDEWIELYNACDHTVNLKDWYLEDNQGETYREIIHNNHPIDAGGFVVLASNAALWNTYWNEIPSNAFKISIGSGNKMFNGLANGGDRVVLYDPDGNQIDEVSYGIDTWAFDPSVPDVAEGHSISRAEKGVDTDTAADWIDTYNGSTPPGPNPGTNPHDSDGNLILPDLTENTPQPEFIDPEPESDPEENSEPSVDTQDDSSENESQEDNQEEESEEQGQGEQNGSQENADEDELEEQQQDDQDEPQEQEELNSPEQDNESNEGNLPDNNLQENEEQEQETDDSAEEQTQNENSNSDNSNNSIDNPDEQI